jgi:FAD/FMN-containing dehydrogenase
VGLAREHRRGAEDRRPEHQARCFATDLAPAGVRRARRPGACEAFPEIRIVTFGHIGDGNLHYNQSKRQPVRTRLSSPRSRRSTASSMTWCTNSGGSISAEHGIGQLKREELLRYKSPVEIEMMRAIKRALDPQGLMNPGKVL